MTRRYRQWAGNPAGDAEDPSRCIKSIWSATPPGGRQCARKRGHGPDGLHCKQHDPEAVQARRAASMAKWKADRDDESQRAIAHGLSEATTEQLQAELKRRGAT